MEIASKVSAMNDQTSPCFKKHVQFIDDMQRRTMATGKLMPVIIKDVLEVISVFLWVMMILWVELTSIAIFVIVFVRRKYYSISDVNFNPTLGVLSVKVRSYWKTFLYRLRDLHLQRQICIGRWKTRTRVS